MCDTSRSLVYGGGLISKCTRNCHSLKGPSINGLSIAGVVKLLGTLTGLGKVQPPIVVRSHPDLILQLGHIGVGPTPTLR